VSQDKDQRSGGFLIPWPCRRRLSGIDRKDRQRFAARTEAIEIAYRGADCLVEKLSTSGFRGWNTATQANEAGQSSEKQRP